MEYAPPSPLSSPPPPPSSSPPPPPPVRSDHALESGQVGAWSGQVGSGQVDSHDETHTSPLHDSRTHYHAKRFTLLQHIWNFALAVSWTTSSISSRLVRNFLGGVAFEDPEPQENGHQEVLTEEAADEDDEDDPLLDDDAPGAVEVLPVPPVRVPGEPPDEVPPTWSPDDPPEEDRPCTVDVDTLAART